MRTGEVGRYLRNVTFHSLTKLLSPASVSIAYGLQYCAQMTLPADVGRIWGSPLFLLCPSWDDMRQSPLSTLFYYVLTMDLHKSTCM
jgi:hypothetical protein